MRKLQFLALLLPMVARADTTYDYTITAPLVTDSGDWDTSSSWQISFEVVQSGSGPSMVGPMIYGTFAENVSYSQPPTAGDSLFAFVIGCAANSPWGMGGCNVGGGELTIAWSSPTLGYDLAFTFAGYGNGENPDTWWTTPGFETFSQNDADMCFEANACSPCPAGECTVLITTAGPVPEPSTLLLLGTALAAVGVGWVRKGQARK